MKKPIALAIAYLALHIALEQTPLVASALSGSASALGWLALLLLVLLRLVVVWIVPGWLVWIAVERALARRSPRGPR